MIRSDAAENQDLGNCRPAVIYVDSVTERFKHFTSLDHPRNCKCLLIIIKE